MRRRVGLFVVLGIGLTVGAGNSTTAASCPVSSCVPALPLRLQLGASLWPKRLSKDEFAPVSAKVFGTVKTTDGTHPSALRELALDIDKDVAVDIQGLPRCGLAQIAESTPDGARRACHGAVVGRGTAYFELAWPEQRPAIVKSRLTAFNSGKADGRWRVLLHAYVPAPAAVARTTIESRGTGLNTITRIPPIADGSASIIDFELRLGRTYVDESNERSYLSARCPDGLFKVNIPKVLFRNETLTPGVAATTGLKGGLTVPCTPKG